MTTPLRRHDPRFRAHASVRRADRPLPVLFAVALIVLAASGCGRSASGREDQLTVTGSTTVLPIAEVAAEGFKKTPAGKKVLVSGVGSSAGIEAVSKGTVDIGTSSRDLKDDEKGLGLVDTPIAYDAIAVIVNPSNPVRSLTTAQARDIFAGRLRNWKDVGGPDLPIGLVNRDEASGTREAFSKIVMKASKEAPKPDRYARDAVILPGTGQVRAVVAAEPMAVGYISLGFVTDDVRAVAIDGVAPTPRAVTAGSYPIMRKLHFFTKGAPTGLVKAFIDYVLSPEIQESIVRDAGFLPMSAGGAQGG